MDETTQDTQVAAPEAAPTPQQDAQARDARDAEVLQGLLAQADGQSPSLASAEQEPEAEAPPAAPEGAAEPAGDKLEAARAELKRHQLHKDIIDALTPEQLLAQAETLKGLRAERDRDFNQQDALMKRLEALEARTAAGSEDGEAGDREVAQPSKRAAAGPDLSEALQPVDGDLYEGVPEALTATAAAMAGYTEERIVEAMSPVVEQVNGLLQEVVRRELAGEYPQLRDAQAFGKVQQAMVEIAPRVQVEGGSAFDQVYAAMSRASQIELGAGGATSDAPPQDGGLKPPTRNPAPKSPMSSDEQSRQWLKTAFGTGSAAAANRAAGL